MKSKIVLNILIIYFLILTTVLLIQIVSKKTDTIEPLPTNITAEDKLKNSVVCTINSPVVIVNEKQFLIDENNSTLVPVIEEGKVYIPVKLLATAFGANISFNKDTKETIVRLDNKAIVFSNNGTNIKLIDNTNEKSIDINEKPKIINDRFYIPLRSFVDIFDKEVFYNNDLIIISNMANLFDPIQEIETLEALKQQVQHLPIIGNEENLKHLLLKKSNTKQQEQQKTNLLNIENLSQTLQQQNNPVIIKKTNNFNIYATKGFIEAYFVTKQNKEIFSFKVEKINDNIKDIQIIDDRFVITYEQDETQTIIYDISDTKNVKTIRNIKTNGYFYKNIIDDSSFYTITKLKPQQQKPYFFEYIYENDNIINLQEKYFNLDEIFYFPDLNDDYYTLVSYTNLYDAKMTFKNSVYLGMGDNVLINEDLIYVLTFNGTDNNIYQFKSMLDGIQYVNREFIKGDFKSFEIDNEKDFLKVNLKDNIVYFDDSLTKR